MHGAGRTTVRSVSDDGPQPLTPGNLAALALSAGDAKGVEHEALQRRDAAVVAAVRAGARLDEIAIAAGVTKAAVSATARKTLAPRSARGGPYRRRRGVEAALAVVRDASEIAAAATQNRRLAIRDRDKAIVAAADDGIPIRLIADVLNMDRKVLNTLIRRRRKEAMGEPIGTLASPVGEGITSDTIA